ncbi:MAG: GldG family protein [Polyangiaceae bacterium]
MAKKKPSEKRVPPRDGEERRSREQRSPSPKPSGVSPTFKVLAAAGVVAAAVIAVLVNVLVARFYKRWDVTRSGLYTLSQATVETLHSLSEPVEVIVFLSASDPLSVSVRHMLSAYGAETTKLSARYVDPDRSPAEFLALQQKYGIVAGKTEDGRVVTDASLVIARGDRHWFVTTDDMVAFDEEDGRSKPKLEQALTEGLRNVLEKQSTKLCFSVGHQEISLDDGGPQGLGELRFRLQKNNYEIVAYDFSAPTQASSLDECQVVAVVGPEVRVPDKVAERLVSYLKAGGNVLVLANPMLDEDNRIQSTGLEPLGRAAGVEFGNDFIVEKAEEARLPQGLGETFFAPPRAHAVTTGLLKGDKARFKVLLSAAQSLRAAGGSAAEPLLATSGEAFSLKDVRPFVEQGKPVEKSPSDAQGPFTVAYAVELPKVAGKNAAHGPRAVFAGSANLAWSRNWRDPTLLGNRLFLESAVSWLAARPTLVSVPEKQSFDAGLALTEESLGEVLRYVLVYMPISAGAIGAFVMLRRRSKEKRSRAAHAARSSTRPSETSSDEAESDEEEEDER